MSSSDNEINRLVGLHHLAFERQLEQELADRRLAQRQAVDYERQLADQAEQQAATAARLESIRQLCEQFYAWVQNSGIQPHEPHIPDIPTKSWAILQRRRSRTPPPAAGWTLAIATHEERPTYSDPGTRLADSRSEVEHNLAASQTWRNEHSTSTYTLICTVQGELVELEVVENYFKHPVSYSIRPPDLSRYTLEDIHRRIAAMVYESGVRWP